MAKELAPAGLLDALRKLSRPELVELWQAVHGCRPPKGVKRPLLEHSAGWHRQEKRLGGLAPDARRHLASLVAATSRSRVEKQPAPAFSGDCDSSDAPSDPPPKPVVRRRLHPGDRLLREWNGRNHVVEVVEGGFIFDGKKWKSLSAIARRITGAHWSGPRFFGL